jgi:hypothetical protein
MNLCGLGIHKWLYNVSMRQCVYCKKLQFQKYNTDGFLNVFFQYKWVDEKEHKQNKRKF